MSRLMVAMLAVGVGTSFTSAGTVEFIPEGSTIVNEGGSVTFNIRLVTDLSPPLGAMSIIVGSDTLTWAAGDATPSADFATEFGGFGEVLSPAPAGLTNYLSDAQFTGFSSLGFTSPFNVGQLVVSTAGLGIGEYTIMVDPSRDSGSSFVEDFNFPAGSQDLTGMATVTVVPEPATLVLLGIGGLAALRRRRA